jgi:hypothetical protein
MLTEFFQPRFKGSSASKQALFSSKQSALSGAGSGPGVGVQANAPHTGAAADERPTTSSRTVVQPSVNARLLDRIKSAQTVPEAALEELCCHKVVSQRRSVGVRVLLRQSTLPRTVPLLATQASRPQGLAGSASQSDWTQLDPAAAIRTVKEAASSVGKVSSPATPRTRLFCAGPVCRAAAQTRLVPERAQAASQRTAPFPALQIARNAALTFCVECAQQVFTVRRTEHATSRSSSGGRTVAERYDPSSLSIDQLQCHEHMRLDSHGFSDGCSMASRSCSSPVSTREVWLGMSSTQANLQSSPCGTPRADRLRTGSERPDREAGLGLLAPMQHHLMETRERRSPGMASEVRASEGRAPVSHAASVASGTGAAASEDEHGISCFQSHSLDLSRLFSCSVWSCMHACIHTHVHTYIHAYNTCVHTCMHAYIHTYIHTCIHTYIHTCKHANMHTCIHTCIHACIHVHICHVSGPYVCISTISYVAHF